MSLTKFAIALLLAGFGVTSCQAPSSTTTDPSGSPQPEVPALHPLVDELDESVVTISTAPSAEVAVQAKVADTQQQRRQGLMHVSQVPDGVGMLFLFETERDRGFWMRNTLVALDIAYIDAHGTIVEIMAMEPCRNTDPADCEVYAPRDSYHAALEVAAGWFSGQGVRAGDHVVWSDPVPAG